MQFLHNNYKQRLAISMICYCAVVDVYSAWCGPCKAVVGLLRRVKNEIGDDLLRFAIVHLTPN